MLLLSDLVLFIDAEALVIDKPAGLPVDQPRRGGEPIASRLDELKAGFRRRHNPGRPTPDRKDRSHRRRRPRPRRRTG